MENNPANNPDTEKVEGKCCTSGCRCCKVMLLLGVLLLALGAAGGFFYGRCCGMKKAMCDMPAQTLAAPSQNADPAAAQKPAEAAPAQPKK